MTCRDFERALDAVFARSDGAGAPELRSLLERHAAQCQECSELLELARLPQLTRRPEIDTADLAGQVLARTSGGACRQAELSLNEFVTGLLDARDRGLDDLIAGHLEHCRGCAELAGELERLSAELPRLARVEPEISLVPAVLRRTLPLPVQLRRWWVATWPRWVQRPRFAVEFAFAATLVLVVVFATPGSPLQAMPDRAFGLVRAESLNRLEILPAKAQGEIASKLRFTGAEAERLATDWLAFGRAGLGTISGEVASWFVIAEDEPPAQDRQNKERP